MSYIGKQLHDLPGQMTAVASGTLANGSKVVVNSDGTVSVVAQSTSSISQAVGTPVVFDSGNGATYESVAFDSNSNRIVVVYRDVGDSNKGTAIVGTVNPSNNSIAFGTPVVFNNGDTLHTDVVFDSNSNKVVVLYRASQSTGYGHGIAGTVDPSDNSIAFGTAVAFTSHTTQYIRATFDSSSNKVVVSFTAQGNSDYGTAVVGAVIPSEAVAGGGNSMSFGTQVVFRSASASQHSIVYDSNAQKVLVAFLSSSKGRARVGTVTASNNSIAFGTEAEFFSTYIANTTAAFDSTSNKTVIFFADYNASNAGKARVATINGTDVSFGTTVQFEAGSVGGNETDAMRASFDSLVNKVIVAYKDGGNSNQATAAVGTVSGTNISFATPFVFDATSSEYFGTAFDSTNSRVVIAYQDAGDSNKGTSTVVRVAGSFVSTNLTAENYIGISNAVYASGQTATIQVASAVDDAQSSLTPGQTYFVQADGTLGTSAGDPSVIAGTAVSSTELAIKG